MTQAFDMAWRGDPTSLGASADWTFSGTSPGMSIIGSFFAQTSIFSSDTLTITGGSGAGVLQVAVNVDGTSGTTGEMSVTPCVAVAGSVDCGIGTFVYQIPFTFGQAFAFNTDFNVFIAPTNGVSLFIPAGSFFINAFGNFLNSADFSFLVFNSAGAVSAGSVITSNLNGFIYHQEAAPVPEPATLVLVGVGLALAGRRLRRTQRS